MSDVGLWLGVALLGGAGSVLRMLVDEAVLARIVFYGLEHDDAEGPLRPTPCPVGIFVVNITGAFVAGVLAGTTLTDELSLLALTAFVGGYTTFSTWMLDTLKLADAHALGLAAANLAVSVVVGFAAAFAGHAVGLAL